jgi:emp24/gp25L/p24 family/GOLD
MFLRYCCLLGLLFPQRLQAAWTLTIPPYEEECFLLKTPSSMKTTNLLVGDYEMIDDGGTGVSAEPLLVYVMEAGKDEKILWRSKPADASGSFRVPITGVSRGYWMCLQNSNHAPDNHQDEKEHPDHVTRMIGFNFRVESIHEKPAPLVFTDQQQDEWKEKSGAVEQEMRTLVNHHDYMRMREANHRSVVESTFASTLLWTMLELGLAILVAAGQVMYFRRFLERKAFL